MDHFSRLISTDKSSFLVIGNLLYISQTRVNLGTHPAFLRGGSTVQDGVQALRR